MNKWFPPTDVSVNRVNRGSGVPQTQVNFASRDETETDVGDANNQSETSFHIVNYNL